jgi:hypothetical protein
MSLTRLPIRMLPDSESTTALEFSSPPAAKLNLTINAFNGNKTNFGGKSCNK